MDWIGRHASGRTLAPIRMRVLLIATLLSCLATATMTGLRTTAAGSAAFTSNASLLSAGQVNLTDDDSGTAAFSTGTPRNDGNLSAGQVLTRCIAVTYSGTWTESSVTDNFSSQDWSKWSGYSAGAVVSGGQFRSTTSTSYYQLTSASTLDFRNASATIEAVQMPNVGNGGTVAYLEAKINGTTWVSLVWGNNVVKAREKLSGGFTTDASVTWDAVAMRWWRIKSIASTVSWQYSANGATWTTLRTTATTLDLSSLRIGIGSGYQGTEPSPGTAIFDNYRLRQNTGNNPEIRLYGSSGGSLAPYLDLVIDRGTGGAFGDCTGFSSEATVYTGSLSAFSVAASNFSTGVDTWYPSAIPETKTYRIKVTTSTDPAAAGLSATGSFTWEAQTA